MRRNLRSVLPLIVAVALAPAEVPAEVSLPTAGAGAYASVRVKSFRERRFEHVIRQRYDYSCGSAAVATLLSYHFERPTNEREAFDQMYAAGDKERIQREGFSLYEMKLFLDSLGFTADGFRIGLDEVAGYGLPVIVMIEVNGYKHFVVIKGIRDGWALVADPAFGLRKWKLPELEAALASDVVFAIHSAGELGKRYFNAAGEWALLPQAPIGQALDRRSLASFSTMLPAFNEFF